MEAIGLSALFFAAAAHAAVHLRGEVLHAWRICQRAIELLHVGATAGKIIKGMVCLFFASPILLYASEGIRTLVAWLSKSS